MQSGRRGNLVAAFVMLEARKAGRSIRRRISDFSGRRNPRHINETTGSLWVGSNGDDGEHPPGRAVIPENTVGCRRILLGIGFEHFLTGRAN